jgi:hypothetical protein
VQPGEDYRPGSDESEVVHRYFAGQSSAGGNMDAMADAAVVIYRGSRIDDHRITQDDAGGHYRHGQYLTARTELGAARQARARVNDIQWGMAVGLKPALYLQSRFPLVASNGDRCINRLFFG